MAYNIYTNLFVGQQVSNNRSISEPKKTTNKSLIKSWVEAHKGMPALLQEDHQSKGPVLCINFPQSQQATPVRNISWEEFFSAFDTHNYVMVYREKQADEDESPFCKLMRRKAW